MKTALLFVYFFSTNQIDFIKYFVIFVCAYKSIATYPI